MSTLRCYGCSYTFGDGLDDPLNQAWPRTLGKRLGMRTVNKGEPGASTQRTLDSILKDQHKPGDSVIVLWPAAQRIGRVRGQTGKYETQTLWDPAVARAHAQLYTDEDLAHLAYTRIFCASLYLKSRGVTQYHIPNLLQLNTGYRPTWFPKGFGFLQAEWEYVDYANDDAHPGVRSHTLYSRRVYEAMRVSITDPAVRSKVKQRKHRPRC